LCVNQGVLNVDVSQVVPHEFNAESCIQQMGADGMAQAMDRVLRADTGALGILFEQLLDSLAVQIALAPGEKGRTGGQARG